MNTPAAALAVLPLPASAPDGCESTCYREGAYDRNSQPSLQPVAVDINIMMYFGDLLVHCRLTPRPACPGGSRAGMTPGLAAR